MMNFEGNFDGMDPGLEQLENPQQAVLEPEVIEAGGQPIEIWGDPYTMGEALDDYQGDNVFGFQGNCGLVTISNMLTMAGIACDEDMITAIAINTGLCEYDVYGPPEENGGTYAEQRSGLLEMFGLENEIFDAGSKAGSLEAIASYVEEGRLVNLSVNAGYLWGDANYIDQGQSNHSVVVTGTVRDPQTGELLGLYICDSGQGGDSDALFVSTETLQDAYLHAAGAQIIVTDDSVHI